MDRKHALKHFVGRKKKKGIRAEDGTTVNPHFYDDGIPSKIPGIGPISRQNSRRKGR